MGMGLSPVSKRMLTRSLIAPMVAHALHNGQIDAATLAILRAIG